MTADPLWAAVDRWIEQWLLPADPVLAAALAASVAQGLPTIHVAPNQGKLLHLLARACGARRILEIGTLGGYSTIWLARALPPDGRLVTLEVNPLHARVARANFERAGLAARIDVLEGPALATLERLARADEEPFDFVFVDADKPSYCGYLDGALALSHPGTVLVFDNVVRRGEVLDTLGGDANAAAMRRLHERIAAEPRVSATTVQTVGAKGHDGFTLALVNP